MSNRDDLKIDELTPSLLENESRGGDIGEGGISFQAEVVLSYVPKWLRMEGFTSMVRESMGDTESNFFVPGRGYIKEFLEVKNHQVTPSEFWKEVGRFIHMDAGAPDEYQWFTLASAGLSQNLHPLVNGLRRIRDPYDFYEGSAILDNSYKGYVQVVEQLGGSAQVANFLYRKVLIVDDLSLNRSYGRALFKQAFRDHLPHYQDLPDRALDDIYESLAKFLQSRRNQTINRMELEGQIRDRIPEHFKFVAQPVRIHTAIADQEADIDRTELQFRWTPFFGGETKTYPPPEIWNRQLLGELKETKDWILKCRSTRRIILAGNRRLSASLAIGSVFSAVSGFSIGMVYRDGIVWMTDAHADENTPEYPLVFNWSKPDLSGERLVVSVGIIREITAEVEGDLERQGLAGLPTLHIKGERPITSPQQVNLVVSGIKSIISKALSVTGARQIELFFAGPAFLALFLGHRLNATAHVQCYERVGPGSYVPTCLLSR